MKFWKKNISFDTTDNFEKPIRAELLSAGQLEKYAEELARSHKVLFTPIHGVNLSKRVELNEDVLIAAHLSILESIRNEQFITSAAEWIVDNFYIAEEQIKDIREHLPIGYYKELPKLTNDSFKGLPRVYAIAWEFVAHTDSLFDQDSLKLILKSYQKIQPLTMGEIWAISITIKLVLVENLRRLASIIVGNQIQRTQADLIADEVLGVGSANKRSTMEIIENLKKRVIPKTFLVQIIHRFRFQEGVDAEIVKWLDERLITEGYVTENILQEEHSSQTAGDVTVKNIIHSMRLISSLDWREFFEEVSFVDEKLQEYHLYGLMDFYTRDKYRHSIEELSRGSKLSEIEVANFLIKKINDERGIDKSQFNNRNEKRLEIGYYLLSSGRYEIEKEIQFKLKFRHFFLRWYIANREIIYLGSIGCFTAFFLSICFLENNHLEGLSKYLLVLFGIIPASELAVTIINRLTAALFLPRHLPRLDFSRGIPSHLKTFVVVPTMFFNEKDIENQVEELEVHYLSNSDSSIYFALLSDWKDSSTEHLQTDEYFLSIAVKKINYLNKKYGKSNVGKNRFYIFHRFRKWNESEQKWIGYERKRGKLQEFNSFLRGSTDTSFIISDDINLDIPKDIFYVVTLDADTKLPLGVIGQLVGTLAHPLNHPKFDLKLNKVIEGYGILQPRITPVLPSTIDSTFFQKLSSGPCGIDPYAAAISDVYQDLFDEGSYTGKGIYNVDVFNQAMKGRTPENRLLSHDLYEGNFARCALLSDVELFEEFPSNFEVAARRNHRWIRGDWQLLPWIFGRGGRSISVLGRWKMLDNLRRTLLNPMIFILLFMLFPMTGIKILPWLVLSLMSLGFNHLLPFFENLISYKKNASFLMHVKYLLEDLFLGMSKFILNIIFIPYHAWINVDAIFRTLIRLVFTKKKLLEWTTSAQTKSDTSLNLLNCFHQMFASQLIVIFLVANFIYWFHSNHWEIFGPLLVLWMSSPVFAWVISLPPKNEMIKPLTTEDIFILRNSARKIWRFFSAFVTAEENFLPPDNFQEEPYPVIAHRSSPTNFGLYLLSVVTARDFGWIGIHEMVERLEATLQSMKSLPRYNGHFYNWYETTDKRALEPRYISSVDNGNLAGHLLALAQTCEEMAGKDNSHIDFSDKILSGIDDSLRLLRIAFFEQSDFLILSIINDLEKILLMPYLKIQDKKAHWEILLSRSAFLLDEIKSYGGKKHKDENNEIHNWALIIGDEIKSHAKDYFEFEQTNGEIVKINIRNRLLDLAKESRILFYEMDFSFLFDPSRKLFSIGHRMSESSLDPSYYDLLASEARLLSFIAIAKGDVPVSHWFRLGRSLTSLKAGSALISWSGSMFEYLMPSLVMQTPVASLLEQTCRLIIKRQISYAKGYSIPWGMSESAYNIRDLHFTYQYSNFGIPDLAFKRGIGKELVVAPYATILAGMYDPINAVKNMEVLSQLNAEGIFGFYEAIDFTKSRVPDKNEFAIVKTYMAHHQGMSLVSISNILHDSLMIKRFHREPIILSSELLLQERTPRNVAIPKTRMETVKIEHIADESEDTERKYFSPHHRVPRTHLLSNGDYSLMITTAGSGNAQFRELSLTRWREDVTCDQWGSYIYLRDIHTNDVWSAGFQPTCVEPNDYKVVFTEDRAKISRQDKLISTHLEVFISSEDNAEIRRVSLTNNGPEVRVIETTSYLEIVLNVKGADVAHPAFSNLFIQTEYVSEITSLIATRRARSIKEKPLWMAQVLSVDSNFIGEIEYETDRARFIGRGHSLRNPEAMNGHKLSNTTGSVIDPMIGIRSRVRIEPGATATITYTNLIANTRDEIINLAEKYHEASSFDRASSLAWNQAQVKLHYLGIKHGEANLFQKLANRVLFLDSSLRVSSDILKRNTQNATNLWSYGISGDYPIVLLRIDDIEQRQIVRQLLRAHEYWKTKGLIVDLIILNEKIISYSQELQNTLEAMVAASVLAPGTSKNSSKGKVFLIRLDTIPQIDHYLFQTAARAILEGRLGNLSEQVKRMIRKIDDLDINFNIKTSPSKDFEKKLIIPKLNFYNGYGGFSSEGKEYIIYLKNNESTPAPWINIIANSQFGFQVSESGATFTWSMNSRENQLTPWSNDPVCDPSGECFYIYDQDNYELWSPTTSPIRVKNAEYLITHGFGYSQFELHHLDIHSILTQFVHNDSSVKISKLVLKNNSNKKRNLIITSYVEWVLGFSRSDASTFIVTDYDEKTGSLISRNSWNQEFGSRVAFATFVGGNDSWTSNRTEFIGRNGNISHPQLLYSNNKFSKKVGAGIDACAALQKNITIEANQEVTIVFLLGQCENQVLIQEMINAMALHNVDDILTDVRNKWKSILGKIQVETPDLSMNIMLNGWLLYQTIACRLWARSAFYQAGGAIGFRDQLQDSMAVIWTKPEMTKTQILKAASRQFLEGDVQHWWHIPSGRGVRTHFSDDLLWLPFVVSFYLSRTEDLSILDEEIYFLTGPLLKIDEEDSYYTPEISSVKGSVFEHCALAIDRSLKIGVHGLPLMGGGDWNDGMNRVGHEGKGESVWLAWFLIYNLTEFIKIAKFRGEEKRLAIWENHLTMLKSSIENNGWDGEWYRRAFYDNGDTLGSAKNSECRIDSLAQTWSVISKSGDPQRAKISMESVEKNLVKNNEQLILLFSPPFDKSAGDPGYIKGYIPGVRENGGQYTHAAIWCIQAYAGLNNGQRAVEIFSILNPINHSLSKDDCGRYKVEPYVIAADVYSEAPHVGRGGWTWYTGAAGWMYTSGIESILGFKLVGTKLTIDPHIHPSWKSYKIRYCHFSTNYEIEIVNPAGLAFGAKFISLDGKNGDSNQQSIELIDDGLNHLILIKLI